MTTMAASRLRRWRWAAASSSVTHPDKVVFPDAGVTKLDLIDYYLAVADGALRGVAGRPMILKRFVKGINEEAIFQKRAPEKRPDWIDVAELKYASGTSAKEAVIHDAAGLVWAVNLGCVDLNPHPVRAGDLEHPDELRVDLDPMPGVEWQQIVDVALVATRRARGLRADGVAEDVGVARASTSTRASRRTGRTSRCDWPPRRSPARSSAAHPTWRPAGGGRRNARASSSTSTRTPRTARSRRRTRCARARTPGCRRRCTGTRCPAAGPRRSPSRRCPRGSPRSAIRGRAWTTPVGGLDRLLQLAEELGPAEKAQGRGARGSGNRVSTMPLIEIARTKTKDEAMAALDTWKPRYPAAADLLEPVDVLVDGMRGPSSIWYRIRINLQHVPEDQRPPQEELIADYSPWEGYTGRQWRR